MNKNKLFLFKTLIIAICISIFLLVIYNTKIKNTKAETYTNSNLGLSLNFPDDWHDKYTVQERNGSIFVYFVSTNSDQRGLLFALVKLNPNGQPANGDIYDSIGTSKTFDINGSKYKAGGTTDIGFPDDNPDFKTYTKMKSQTSKILKTLKTSN